jgi:hypothetical protein
MHTTDKNWSILGLGPKAVDDPILDATDGAHPAWWRGDDHGAVMAAIRLEKAVDGKDLGDDVIGSPDIERVRRKILALRQSCHQAGWLEYNAAKGGNPE